MRGGEKNPDFPGWEELHAFTVAYSMRQVFNLMWDHMHQPPGSIIYGTSLYSLTRKHYPEWREDFTHEVCDRVEAEWRNLAVHNHRLEILP